MQQTVPAGRDWFSSTHANVTRIVDPSFNMYETYVTGRVPSFTSISHGKPDPYRQMSASAFQNCVPARDHFLPFNTGPVRCWLPSDVRVDRDGRVAFASYINNLHPLSCKPIYSCLKTVLAGMLPAFERVLGDLRLHSMAATALFVPPLPQRPYVKQCLDQRPRPSDPSVLRASQHVWSLRNMSLHGRYQLEQGRTISRRRCRGRLFCSDLHNVTTSAIDLFCPTQRVTTAVRDPESVAAFSDASNRLLGGMPLRKGAAIVWPSFYDAQLAAFKVDDPSLGDGSGWLTFARFYLVAPDAPMVSAADVPSQCALWSTQSTIDLANRFEVPDGVVDVILEFHKPKM